MTKRRRRPLRLLLVGATLAALPLLASGTMDAGVDPAATAGIADRMMPRAGLKPRLDVQMTAAIALPDVAPALSVDLLRRGLDALAEGDVDEARAVRDGMPRSSVDRHVMAWAIAMRGGGEVTAAEIEDAMRRLSGWPGLDTMRRNRERALYRERPEPGTIVEAIGAEPPKTLQGTIALVRARVALGDEAAARDVLSAFWRRERLEARDETRVLAEFGRLLSQADHRARMERMLYGERIASAQRMAALAGAKPLADAWTAVIRGDKTAEKLLAAVPADQRAAGYAFAEAKNLRKRGKHAEAAAVVLKAPTDAALLVDPDAWWIERRVLSRELLDEGDVKTAYGVAAGHAAEMPANAADAEFHAGWYALRGLMDPKAAAGHFARIAEVAEGPISLSRAYYWMGRAAEAGGPGDARALYGKAAAYGTTFYGQLAAERAGGHTLDVSQPAPSEADRVAFAGREAVRAIARIEAAGHETVADSIYRALAAELASPGEVALLAAMAEKRGDHFLALRIGKAAAARGIDVGGLSHPVGAIPASADISGAGKALAYAIARQESEFNVAAVSGAGARGLLQLMPGTAKEVAQKAGLAYSRERLTTDPGYNATLGSAFLGEQLGRFDGSYVLTFAGYNAGPSRARQWVKRYGDPRGKDIDTVVDWIERIPFSETRSYVQRVMENYQVYKMRLTGAFDIEADLMHGR